MIGIFGGSGFYSLLENAKERELETPYGKTSSKINFGKIGKEDVVFIARHGIRHELPPHKVPYKSNVWAFKELGVERIIAPAAVGSLKARIKPGDFLVPDQFVSFTRRSETFYNGPQTTHISSAEPYCDELRKLMISEGKKMKMTVHDKGTVVVIQGPRFASGAESEFYRKQGWDIINMTVYPELILARELEMCYANIAIITDYDTGLKSDARVKPVSMDEIVKVFKANNERIKQFIFNIVPKIPKNRKCICATALEGSRP